MRSSVVLAVLLVAAVVAACKCQDEASHNEVQYVVQHGDPPVLPSECVRVPSEGRHELNACGNHFVHKYFQGMLATSTGLCYKRSIPVCFGRFEFHAEWLRDEPFDATTTGQNKGVPVSTLSWRQGT